MMFSFIFFTDALDKPLGAGFLSVNDLLKENFSCQLLCLHYSNIFQISVGNIISALLALQSRKKEINS